MRKKIGYGVVLWAIPYVTAIPLLPLMRSDQPFFKTIMIVEGALLGAMLEEARKRRLRRVFGYITAHNLASLRVYRHAGLRHRGQWWSNPTDRFAASEEQLLVVEALLD